MIDLEPMLQAVRQSADLCRRVRADHLSSSEKKQNDPVTIADYGSQAIIGRTLIRHYSGDAVIAEEQGQQFIDLVPEANRTLIAALLTDVLDEKVREDDIVRWMDHGHGREAEQTWLVDPIDGTKGFLAGRSYVIAVGLLDDHHQPVGAVIGAPGYPSPDNKGALFYAQGGSAYMRSLGGGSARQIQVTATTDPAQVRVLQSVEKGHSSEELMDRVRIAAGFGESPLEFLDSQEKYARIAAGDGELYLRLPRLNSNNVHFAWDHAAGTALVLAAGGTVTDVDGSPLDFSHGSTLAHNQGIIVSNGHIHDQLIAAAQQVLSEG